MVVYVGRHGITAQQVQALLPKINEKITVVVSPEV